MAAGAPRREIAVLVTILIVGGSVCASPVSLQKRIQTFVVDMAAPGQKLSHAAMTAAHRNLRKWRETEGADREAIEETEQELAAARQEVRSLVARLAEAQQENATLRMLGTDAGRSSSGEPLLTQSVVRATVLGPDSVDAIRSGLLIARGADGDVRENSLVLEETHPLIDQGAASGLGEGQPLLAGRCLVGRIVRSGRWVSSVLPVSDPEFRGLARIVRRTPEGGLDSGEGLLEGAGGGLCRLKHVPSTCAVSPGDHVYSSGGDALSSGSLYYGEVIRAELTDGASHWEIVVKPAVEWARLKTVQVVQTEMNAGRMLAQ